MSNISANTLFHFTPKFEYLLSILENGFRPSYCKEFGPSINNKIRPLEIPMVCFCDLPISSLSEHIGLVGEGGYGKFGLGMSKEWGIANKLNSVTYTTESHAEIMLEGLNIMRKLRQDITPKADSIIEEKIVNKGYKPDDFNKAFETLNEDERAYVSYSIMAHDAIMKFILTLYHVKPYQDAMTGKRYYDEREWRRVVFSDAPNTGIGAIFLDKIDDIPGKKEYYQTNILKYHMLQFNAQDIKYIILESDQQIDALIQKLESLPEKYSEVDRNRLIGRIITCDQIREDF